MKYLRLYNYESEHEADALHWVENKYSTCYMREEERPNRNYVVDYHKNRLTVQQLIDQGYAEVKQDRSRKNPGSEVNFSVIQIHPDCPVGLENIIDFDDYLTSATTFVWREALPSSWSPVELANKYSDVELARPIIPEMFPCVDLSGVDELTLSFSGGGSQYVQSSIISQRYNSSSDYYSGITFKTPKHLIVTVRNNYSSVAQTNFSMLNTTTALTLNCQVFNCHDVTGMFEANPRLVTLEINGSFRWDGIRTCHLMFDGDDKLTSIPYVTAWGRESNYNTIYPRYDGTRGSANCGGLFNATGLTSIGPRVNMNAINLSGATVDGNNQARLPYAGKGVFYCPNCTDVRIINLNNNDWNFADNSTYTYLPKMDVESIEYLLNHVADCSENPHTVTFSPLHTGEISQSAIEHAEQNGWTVRWDGDGE